MIYLMFKYLTTYILAIIAIKCSSGFRRCADNLFFDVYNSSGTYRSGLLKAHSSLNSELLGITNTRSEDLSLSAKDILQKCGILSKLASGIYTLLPVGSRIIDRIKRVIVTEMCKLGAVELKFPIIQHSSLFECESNPFSQELYKVVDRDTQKYVLSPTCEDLATVVLRDVCSPFSKKFLPLVIYQINAKFRDEIRANSLRCKEFLMKDAYSFHSDEKSANEVYLRFMETYGIIFDVLGIKYNIHQVDDNVSSHEFRTYMSKKGEDDMNNAIEVAHIFKFGTLYTKKHEMECEGSNRKKEEVYMNSYGIGIYRLLNALVYNNFDKYGIKLAQVVAPYDVALISCDGNMETAAALEKFLLMKGLSVMYDKRDIPIKDKIADMKRIGVPHMLLLSDIFQLKEGNVPGAELINALSERCKVSNHYNLGQFSENRMSRNQECSIERYLHVKVEYHPRMSDENFVIPLYDFIKILNVYVYILRCVLCLMGRLSTTLPQVLSRHS